MDPMTASRNTLDLLLSQDYTEHAIHQGMNGYNEIPTTLVTFFKLGYDASQLRDLYEFSATDVRGWLPSPAHVTLESRFKHFGDTRYQRAYMNYFGLHLTQCVDRPVKEFAAYHLSQIDPPADSTDRTLLHGLFANSGRSLMLLSDAFQLPQALMVVQALTLAAVDWSATLADMISRCDGIDTPQGGLLPADFILGRIGQDSTFSNPRPGRRKNGSPTMDEPLKECAKKNRIVYWVNRLDLRDINATCKQLARLSVAVACATHKPGKPAFDIYLARLPSLVATLPVLLDEIGGSQITFHTDPCLTLIRGVFLLIVIIYISQLRPIIDRGLAPDCNDPGYQTDVVWDFIKDKAREMPTESLDFKWRDPVLMKLLLNMQELSVCYGQGEVDERPWYRAMAWHVAREWRGWCGRGGPEEEYLNIRL
ncbi:hypothetical protein GE09DRAFT_469051 [Coniochaeta sp. 2T2.1]|nr:hypothetical protein GE09DRAFT_469051 [Coniochaeta sp. 2T2.1]